MRAGYNQNKITKEHTRVPSKYSGANFSTLLERKERTVHVTSSGHARIIRARPISSRMEVAGVVLCCSSLTTERMIMIKATLMSAWYWNLRNQARRRLVRGLR